MAITLLNLMNDFVELRDFFDAVNGLYSTVATAKNAVVTRFDTSGVEDIISDSESVAATLADAFDQACNDYKTVCEARLLHPLQTEDQTRYAVTDSMTQAQKVERGLFALHARMLTETKTVQSNSVTVGSVTSTKTKANAGTLTTCSYLSGVDAPTADAPSNYNYFDLVTELAKTDTCMVECVSDVQSGTGILRGFETFRISGKLAENCPFGNRFGTDGDGSVAYCQPLQADSVIDLGFDAFTSDAPDDWSIITGAASTEIFEETTNVVGGTGSSLRLTGTAEIRRSISPAVVRGRSQMYLAFLLRKDGATSGTYTISVTGTGFTTVTSGALNASSLTTTFTPLVMRVPVPANIPSDFRINIATSAVSGGNGILIDQGALAEATYWNGVGVAISEGEDSFTVGDRYTFTISNDYAGDAQTTFAKLWRAQMPSLSVGYDYA